MILELKPQLIEVILADSPIIQNIWSWVVIVDQLMAGNAL